MDFVLANAGLLNLCAGAAVALSALLILRFRSSIGLEEFMRATFLFWLLQWIAFVFIYVALAGTEPNQHLTLAFVDLSGVFALGLSLIFVRGKSYDKVSTVFIEIAAVYVVLLVWNFCFLHPSNHSTIYRQIWILPSKTIAAAAFLMSARAFWKRYRLASLPLVVVILIYLVLQHPLYRLVFVELKEASGIWFLLIAIGKVFYALTFYAVFFSPATPNEPVPLIIPIPTSGWGTRAAKVTVALASGLLGAFVADLVVKIIFRLVYDH